MEDCYYYVNYLKFQHVYSPYQNKYQNLVSLMELCQAEQ